MLKKSAHTLVRHPGALALVVILLLTGALWQRHAVRPLTEFDQPFYVGIAHDLAHTGRFTDGYFFGPAGPDGMRPYSMRFAPLYPALLAAAAQLDGTLRRNMDCVVDSDGRNPACGRGAPLPRTLQFAELGGFLWLVWWLGAAAGGTQAAAWLTLGLALMTTTVLLQSVDYLMTEMTCLLLTTAATACGVQAVTQKQRSLWAAAAGALLALAACTRPAFYYLIFVCIAAGGAMALRARRGLWPLAAFAGAAFATLAPWVVRNALVMGHPALSFGYAGEVLVQRIAFDTMNGREYALSYLCWLPDGPGLGRALVGPHACDRFAWDDQPTSFYVLGHVHMLAETLARAGGNEHYLAYLLHTYILRMPVWHMLVSIPLALRGAYIDHWWGFVLLPVALAATASALRHGRAAYLIIALPAWFMLALNATIAVNQTRYNLMLIPVYAVAGAMLLLRWRIAARLGAQTSTEASATIPEG